jgi:hypothetical protein
MGSSTSRRYAATAVLAAALAGCTSAVPGHGAAGAPPPATARGATYLAMLDLAAASAVRYRGTFDDAGETATLDATVTSSGEATGSLTVSGSTLGLLVLQGVTYLRAPEAFWAGSEARSGITKRYGNSWVRVPPKVFGLDVGAVLAPAALARSQHPVIAGVPAAALADLTAATVGGVKAVTVRAQDTEYVLSADQPYRLLSLHTPAVPRFRALPPRAAVPPKPGTPVPSAADARELKVELTDASADLAAVYAELTRRAGQLRGAIDGQGKVKLGAQEFVGCGATSCTISVNFTNDSGAATHGGLHADWDGGGKPIGVCDAVSTPVPAHHTGSVSCTLGGAGWGGFYARAISSTGGLPYGAKYSVLPLAGAPDTGRLAADATAARCATAATRPAGCPAADAAGTEARDAALRVGYDALRQRFGQGVSYGGAAGPRLPGAASNAVHPDDGYPDLAVYFGDRVFVYQLADPTHAESARQQAARYLAAVRAGLFDRAVLADLGPPIAPVTVRDPHLGRTVTLSSRDGYPGVLFYAIG